MTRLGNPPFLPFSQTVLIGVNARGAKLLLVPQRRAKRGVYYGQGAHFSFEKQKNMKKTLMFI